mgnify:CR=1 FL=1
MERADFAHAQSGRWQDHLFASASSFLWIIAGTAITALGIDLFLVPFHIADGGVVGVAVILNTLWGWPVSLLILALNVPIFIVGWLARGFRFVARTMLGVLSLSLFTEVGSGWASITGNALLATLYAGLITGVGMGLVLRAGGSTGGTDTLARALQHWTGWPAGQTILMLDGVVIVSAGLLIGPEQALYGALSLFLATRAIDFILQGTYSALATTIISAQGEEIAMRIMGELERGVTLLPARGAFTGQTSMMVYVVVRRDQLSALRHLVHTVDPKAFVVLTEAYEVLGEGFLEDREMR